MTGDFDDIDALIGDALLHHQAAKAKKKAGDVKELNRATHAKLDGAEWDDLDALVKEALEKKEWIATHAVVLVSVQFCKACDAEHTWCEGWFTRFKHRTDPHAIKLTKGRPNGLPSTVQRQVTAPIDICGECAACQIAIETAFRTDFQEEGEKE